MKYTASIVALGCLMVLGAGCVHNPFAAKTPDPTNGHLIKGKSYTTVYFLGANGKRYVFPNDKTYLTWFPDFSIVKQISDEDLMKTPLGGNVTYKPGTRLIKVETAPQVYVVTRGGVRRQIASEEVAAQLFGPDWKNRVDDMPDAFFTNYTDGPIIKSRNDFSPVDEEKNTTSIDQDKNLLPAVSSTTP